MNESEYIGHFENDPDLWICLCGSRDFRPCDEDGNEVEPVEGWKLLFVCDQCGRIIDGNNRKVVGLRTRSPATDYKPGEQKMPALPLGELVITPKAEEVLHESGQSPAIFLHMYLTGNWGDCSKEDWKANDEALTKDERVQGVYHTAAGKEIWIITEWNRSATTILTPEEY
jgi:hypothetical protein